MILREMEPKDVPGCFVVRTSVRENHLSREELRRLGITEESVTALLTTTHKGWVCEIDRQIVGFSMGNHHTGELWIIAVRPDYEGRGIGRRLIELTVHWLQARGCPGIWLWTSPDVSLRAYAFYLKSGWEDCGIQDNQRMMKLRRLQSDPILKNGA